MIEEYSPTSIVTLVKPESRRYPFYGMAFNAKAASHLLQTSIFEDDKWMKREHIIPLVEAKHLELGGLPGTTDLVGTVKTVLGKLHEANVLTQAQRGYYSLATSSVALTFRPKKERRPLRFKAHLEIEKVISKGKECIYVYLNPNDRKLAAYEGRPDYECKIGYSKKKDPKERILEQIGTAMSRFPVIGIAIECDDSKETESKIHKVLELAKCHYTERCGEEWFMASPAIIEHVWQQLFVERAPEVEIAKSVLQMKSAPLGRLKRLAMIIKILIFG